MKKKADPATSVEVDHILNAIGLKIREKRKKTHKNYEKFADEHGFNKVTILRLEKGENCTLSTLIQVLHALDLPIEDFFKGIN